MAITQLTDDLDIIAKLDDEPNDVTGLNPDVAKAKFDEAGNIIKDYINDVLIAGIIATNIPASTIVGVDTTTVQTAIADLKSQLTGFALGAIGADTLTTAVMATEQKRGVNDGVAELDSTGNIPSNRLAVLKDMAGRYGAIFGLASATYSQCGLNASNEVDIDSATTANNFSQASNDSNVDVYGVNQSGERLDATATALLDNISAVTVFIPTKTGNPTNFVCTIYDETAGAVIGTSAVATTAQNLDSTCTFSPAVQTVRGNVLQLRFSCTGDGSNKVTIGHNSTGGLNNAFYIATGNSWSTKTDTAGADMRLTITGKTAKYTSGTVVKTYTPTTLNTWGNAKFTETEPANTSVVCDVLDNSNNVIMADVQSLQDLSGISIASYPTIKLRWTFTRVSLTDTTPKMANPSLTFEGVA